MYHQNAPRPADVTADERKAQVTAAVNELLRLKGEYKAATGNEYVPASAKTPPAPPSAGTKKSKEEKKKEKMSGNGDTGADGTKKKEKNAAVATPIEKVIPKTPVYIPSANLMENFKCIYACKVLNKTLPDLAPDDFDAILAPETPAIVDCSTGMLVFSSNVVCKYLCLDENLPSKLQELLHLDEFELLPALYSLLSAKTPLNEGNFGIIFIFFASDMYELHVRNKHDDYSYPFHDGLLTLLCKICIYSVDTYSLCLILIVS